MRNGMHCMLLCRVLMGDSYRTTTSHKAKLSRLLDDPTRRAPDSKDSIFAEAGIANEGNQIHNEYVVFQSQQVYPEYIVWYTCNGQ